MNRKKNRTFQENLEYLARRDGVTVEEVRYEMERVIRLGFLSPDPQIRAKWNAIPCKGEMPTPEEVVAHISADAERKNWETFLAEKRGR